MPYKNASDRSKAVIRWRQRAKRKLAAGFGGKCGICGYNRSIAALEFHHLSREGKDFHFGMVSGKAWKSLVREAKKCAMLCSNHHREVHEGITAIPEGIARFDERKALDAQHDGRAADS